MQPLVEILGATWADLDDFLHPRILSVHHCKDAWRDPSAHLCCCATNGIKHDGGRDNHFYSNGHAAESVIGVDTGSKENGRISWDGDVLV